MGKKSDGDACTGEEKETKTETEVDGQHNRRHDR